MEAIEGGGVGGLEPAQADDEVWLRSLPEQVIVIAHERPGMNASAGARTRLAQRLKEKVAISVATEDVFAAVAAVEDVVNGAGEFDTCSAGHGLAMHGA